MNRFVTLSLLLVLSLSAAALAAEKPSEAVLANTAAMAFRYQDYAEAASAYQRLLEAFPKSAQIKDHTYHQAMALERLGDTQRAAELYQDVVTKHKGRKSAVDGIDSLAMEGVGRCFNKNFREYAVVINGQPITKLEVDAELEKVPPFYRGQFDSEEGRRKFLDQLVERRLLMAEALRLGMANDPEIHARLEETRQNVLIRALVEQEVSRKSQPTEAEIKKHYKEHAKDFQVPEQVRARMITVTTKSKADEVYREAVKKKGLPFDSLAKLHSTDPTARNGGDLGLVPRGQRPELEPSLFKTGKGRVGRPVPIETKHAVVRLEAKQGKKLHIKWILVNTTAEASKVLEALKADPAAFDSLARHGSVDPSKDRGGDLGLVAKGGVDDAVFAAASKLKPGSHSPKPVEVRTKYAVLKVEEHTPAGMKPLDQVRAQISGTMSRERQKAVYEKFMADLKAKARIEHPSEPAGQEK